MTHPLFRDRFKAVADLRATIGIDRVLERPLIIIDEKARRSEGLRMFLLHLVELNGRGDRVSRAAVEMALIVNGRAMGSEIDSGRQRADDFEVRLTDEIAMIWIIRDPAIAPRSARPLRRLFMKSFPQ